MVLHYRVMEALANGAATRTCFVLHGLLGQSRNLLTFTKQLQAKSSPDWRFILVDVRGHGSSPHHGAVTDLSMELCANDLVELSKHVGHIHAAIGHSLGGKILLQTACMPAATGSLRDPASPLPLTLWPLDAHPGQVEEDAAPAQQVVQSPRAATMDNIDRILQIVHEMPWPLPSRKAVSDRFKAEGLGDLLSAWMASNVTTESVHGRKNHPHHARADGKPGGEEWGWTFDPAAASALYRAHLATNRWDTLLQGAPHSEGSTANKQVDVDLVMATKSKRWVHPAVASRIATMRAAAAQPLAAGRGRVGVHEVSAGHWLHVDNPTGLLDVLLPYFSKNKAQLEQQPEWRLRR